jgi:hypothetical protein
MEHCNQMFLLRRNILVEEGTMQMACYGWEDLKIAHAYEQKYVSFTFTWLLPKIIVAICSYQARISTCVAGQEKEHACTYIYIHIVTIKVMDTFNVELKRDY